MDHLSFFDYFIIFCFLLIKFHIELFPYLIKYYTKIVHLITWGGGGMPLHDVVGINCKKGATAENQDSAVKYMG